MNISVSSKCPASDALLVFLYKQEKKKQSRIPYVSQLSSAATKHILQRIKDKDFQGSDGETLTLYFESEPFKRIVLIGLGDKKKFSLEVLRSISATVARQTKKLKAKKVACLLPEEKDYADLAEAFMTGFMLGSYSFAKYVSDKKKHVFHVNAVTFVTSQSQKNIKQRAQEGYRESLGVMLVRDLINTPSAHMTPLTLVKEARKICDSSSKMKIKVFDEKQIKKMGLNLLYSVGAASKDPSRFIVLEYKNKPKNKKPIALVGKGITFDSGGINLKPTNHIEDMKMDMAGAATVLGIFQTLSHSNLPLHVIGIISAAENAIGGGAFRPGDIITAYNKKTVEITNTDAEGRLVLADALSYSVKHYKPEAVVDVATLTGACIAALGYEITALVSNNNKLAKKLKNSSVKTEEPLWELPFYKNYVKKVKSEIADLKNWTSGVSAGTIMGGAFLSEFVDKTPWAHLDIAGTAWSKDTSGYRSQGGTGTMIRLLWNFLKNY
jgi:leucyl aminopeptidase